MTVPPLRNILNDTPADATDVEFNFNTIETYLNEQVLSKDGSVAMEGPITLPGPPTNPNEAATKAYVDAAIPIGVIHDWPVETLPLNMQEQWAICDGRILNVSEYAVLADLLGTTFNRPGDAFGGTQFRLPDFRRRVAVGFDDLTPGFDTIGFNDTLGTADAIVPAHTHAMPHTHPINHDHGAFTSGTDAPDHGHAFTTDAAGQHTHGVTPGVQILATIGSVTGYNTSATGNANVTSTNLIDAGQHAHNGGTAGATARHAHTIDVPAYTGNSGAESTPNTASTGEAVTNKNYPPYLLINKIIKVL